ncbi:MAG TPA: DUF5916 domain-containing protein [Bryobacteraceae bacterium]|nr:DUF5916 domain-containing protein [Bryobacteraceae bacterium]
MRRLAGVLILVAVAATAQQSPLSIPKVARAPKLIDFLENRPREAELIVTEFHQFQPRDGAPVTQPTTAYLSYDDKNLYAAFVCKDDPELIRARVAKREQIMEDDRVNLVIDTFHDHHRAYWFDVNPYGVQADGVVTDGVEDDPSWDTLWYSDARFTKDGYVAMITLPFRSIRFRPGDESWGLVLARWIMRNNEFSVWPDFNRKQPGFVRQGGDLEGFQGISPGRNIQLIPYGSFGKSRYLDVPAEAFTSDNDLRAGLDAKVVLKDAFALDVTLNPDFSQVESDEPQVTVNQRYEVFFPEKRPFFLENQGFFKMPETLFFSRRIADPEFGTRLTGKYGHWALGALAIDDRAPGQRDGSGERAKAGVFRLQREFLRDSNAAAFVSDYEYRGTYNRVAALDTRLRVLPNWILTGQAITSQTRLANGSRMAGPAYRTDFQHSGRHFQSQTTYTDRSPTYRAQLGFVPKVDTRQVQNITGYTWRPERGRLVAIRPSVTSHIDYDRTGRLQEWNIHPRFFVELQPMTEITFGRSDSYEWYRGSGFSKHHTEVEFESEWFRWLALTGDLQRGSELLYYPASGLAPFTSRSTNAETGFTLRPRARLRLDQTYIYTALSWRGQSVFTNHIARFKANYQFNRALSLRTILDYNSVLPNRTLVDLDKEKHLGADVLLTYMVHPGTALYIGYTDLYDNLKLDPRISPALKRTDFPDLNTGRQIFVKLSYLFRF